MFNHILLFILIQCLTWIVQKNIINAQINLKKYAYMNFYQLSTKLEQKKVTKRSNILQKLFIFNFFSISFKLNE